MTNILQFPRTVTFRRVIACWSGNSNRDRIRRINEQLGHVRPEPQPDTSNQFQPILRVGRKTEWAKG